MTENNQLADDLNDKECEPLLPMEKKLVGWCICWGFVLLVLLIWMSLTFS